MPLTYPQLPLARFNKLVNLTVLRIFKSMDLNITREQEIILRALCQQDGMNQVDLAHRVSQDRNNLSRTLGLLETRGWVHRTRDRSDRRHSLVHITDAGRDFHASAFKAIEAYWQVMFKELSQAEIDYFEATLARMSQNLEAYVDDDRVTP